MRNNSTTLWCDECHAFSGGCNHIERVYYARVIPDEELLEAHVGEEIAPALAQKIVRIV